MATFDSSLPDAWVERIWLAMRATYGAAFDRQWQCPEGEDPARHVAGLKAHWGRELARYQQNPEAIRYGLDNLPPQPPNLIEFRAACNRRPDPPMVALPAPKADPARVAESLAKLREPATESQYAGHKGWAYRLRDREAAGDRLPLYSRNAWREALRVQKDDPA